MTVLWAGSVGWTQTHMSSWSPIAGSARVTAGAGGGACGAAGAHERRAMSPATAAAVRRDTAGLRGDGGILWQFQGCLQAAVDVLHGRVRQAADAQARRCCSVRSMVMGSPPVPCILDRAA